MTVKINKQFVLNLINKGESETVEFKASFDQTAIETIVAFANTKGGHVIIGVTDAGKINGVQLSKETMQQWINHIKATTSPSLIPDATVLSIGHKVLVVFVVEEFPVKPISCRGKYLKRIKNANHQMTTRDISDLHLRSYQASWDYYVDQGPLSSTVTNQQETAMVDAAAALADDFQNPKAVIPPVAKQNRIVGGESFAPLPLPATPLRRTERSLRRPFGPVS